jgi:hypothetical protein
VTDRLDTFRIGDIELVSLSDGGLLMRASHSVEIMDADQVRRLSAWLAGDARKIAAQSADDDFCAKTKLARG